MPIIKNKEMIMVSYIFYFFTFAKKLFEHFMSIMGFIVVSA